MKQRQRIKILILCLILFGAVAIGLAKGSAQIKLTELFLNENRQILYLRLARVLLGIFVGAGLSACGVTLQALLRNPLAEPYLLGTSSAAGLGAVIAIILGIQAVYLPFAAFLGALLSVVLVYALAREGGKIPVQSLILSGVIAGIAFSALTVFLVSASTHEALHGIMWWLLGSLQVYDLKLVLVVGALVVGGIISLSIFAQDLNAISIGEEEALHLGIDIERIKKILFLITSLITGALVSVSGIIGFVGLIVPHMLRLIFGPDHRTLILAAAIAGAAFLVVCDLFSRTLFVPVEIPIGVITALIGAPIFIILLKRRQKVK